MRYFEFGWYNELEGKIILKMQISFRQNAKTQISAGKFEENPVTMYRALTQTDSVSLVFLRPSKRHVSIFLLL